MLIKTSNQLINEAKARIQEISVHELANEIGNNHIILIDVREPDEYAAGQKPDYQQHVNCFAYSHTYLKSGNQHRRLPLLRLIPF